LEAEIRLQAFLTSALYGCKQLSLLQAKSPKYPVDRRLGKSHNLIQTLKGKEKSLILLEIIPTSLVIERTGQSQYRGSQLYNERNMTHQGTTFIVAIAIAPTCFGYIK